MNNLNILPKVDPFLMDLIFINLILVVVILFFAILVLFQKIYNDNSHKKIQKEYNLLRDDVRIIIQQTQQNVNDKSTDIKEDKEDVENLVDLAVEIWRLEQRINKIANTLPEARKKSIENSIQKMKLFLEKHTIEIKDYTNQKYNDGLNIDVLAVEKDENLKEPFIKETVEPSIIYKGKLTKRAKVIIINN